MKVAKAIFDRIKTIIDLDAIISQRESESLHLEFKRKRLPTNIELTDGLDVNLSKAISGFANSEGGVLIIGIDAPSNGTVNKDPISNLTTIELKINEYLSRATSFPVEGITVTKIFENLENDIGYIIIYVPESDLAPHRSQKDKLYYLRIGDSFLPMEHYQIADMFGRRQMPMLVPYATIKKDLNSASLLQMIFGLKNYGKASAKFPYLKILSTSDFGISGYGISGNRNFGLPVFIGDRTLKEYRGGLNDIIHSGTMLPITLLEKHFLLDSAQKPIEAFEFKILKGILAADNLPIKHWELHISREDIIFLLNNHGSEKTIEGILT